MNKARFVFKKLSCQNIFTSFTDNNQCVPCRSAKRFAHWRMEILFFVQGRNLGDSKQFKNILRLFIGFLTINKSNIDDVQFFTREDGLSDIKIKTLYYDPLTIRC